MNHGFMSARVGGLAGFSFLSVNDTHCWEFVIHDEYMFTHGSEDLLANSSSTARIWCEYPCCVFPFQKFLMMVMMTVHENQMAVARGRCM
jgi:hypothetical protein